MVSGSFSLNPLLILSVDFCPSWSTEFEIQVCISGYYDNKIKSKKV